MKDEGENTQVDLGEDLLEKTALLSVDLTSVSLQVPEEAQDLLETARILASEGLIEEAKKTLRQILRKDPQHSLARKQMEEIQRKELEHLLAEAPFQELIPKEGNSDLSVEEVIRDLDHDLGLGLFSEVKAMEEFAEQLDREFAVLSTQDRLDLGVAFQEMGLHSVAARQFQAAENDPASYLSATYLLANNLIEADRAFDAVIRIEPLLRDADLSPGDRQNFMYLMGLAQERLGKRDAAIRWYREVLTVQTGYRDTESRLSVLIGRPPKVNP